MIQCRYCKDIGQIQTVNNFLQGKFPIPCPKCNAPKNLKEQALSKLTEEEKKILVLI